MGRAHLAAVRRLVQHPDWLPAALARISATLRPALSADVNAQLELQALAPDRTEPPPWQVSAALPADDLLRFYREAEAETGVPWTYLAAVHFVETRMGRIRSASTAGALGPMQFLPSTWAAYGRGDVNSDHDAIQAAARYLRANGAPASMASALFHYNRSQHYVKAVTAYAEVLGADARAYTVYYHWPVVVHLRTGDVIMNEGGGVETLP
jgi:membrane-bound lytic murein transglycosylase B